MIALKLVVITSLAEKNSPIVQMAIAAAQRVGAQYEVMEKTADVAEYLWDECKRQGLFSNIRDFPIMSTLVLVTGSKYEMIQRAELNPKQERCNDLVEEVIKPSLPSLGNGNLSGLMDDAGYEPDLYTS